MIELKAEKCKTCLVLGGENCDECDNSIFKECAVGELNRPSNGMTEKQREFIDDICTMLGIDYDREDTVEDASEFIDENIREFKKVRFELKIGK